MCDLCDYAPYVYLTEVFFLGNFRILEGSYLRKSWKFKVVLRKLALKREVESNHGTTHHGPLSIMKPNKNEHFDLQEYFPLTHYCNIMQFTSSGEIFGSATFHLHKEEIMWGMLTFVLILFVFWKLKELLNKGASWVGEMFIYSDFCVIIFSLLNLPSFIYLWFQYWRTF